MVYLKQLEEGKNIRLKWQSIAKQLGNQTFQQLSSKGERIRLLLRVCFPDLTPSKKREIKDPKQEWGFDADDVKEFIDAFDANPDPKKGKLSMRKIGELLGHKSKLHPERKPFAERNDRNQLVHCILSKKYPELAKRFERKSTVRRKKKKSINQTNSSSEINSVVSKSLESESEETSNDEIPCNSNFSMNLSNSLMDSSK